MGIEEMRISNGCMDTLKSTGNMRGGINMTLIKKMIAEN